MVEIIISVGLFLAKASAFIVMASACAAIYLIESRSAADGVQQ